MTNDPQKAQLAGLIEKNMQLYPDWDARQRGLYFGLRAQASALVGHVLLDALEEAGFGADELVYIVASSEEATLYTAAVVHAAWARGMELNGSAGAMNMVNVKTGAVALIACGSEETWELDEAAALWREGNQIVAIASLEHPGEQLREWAEHNGVRLASALVVGR